MWALSQEKKFCLFEESSDCLLKYIKPQLKIYNQNHILLMTPRKRSIVSKEKGIEIIRPLAA